MRFYVTLSDLKPGATRDTKHILKAVLARDIKKAMKAGIDRQTAEARVIESRLKRHNFRIPVEL
jgi:hypothetical protein